LRALVSPAGVPFRGVDVAEPELRERDAWKWERLEPRVVRTVRVLERRFQPGERVRESKSEPVDDRQRVETTDACLVLTSRPADRDGALGELAAPFDVAAQPERIGHLGEQAGLEAGVLELGERDLERLERHPGAEPASGELGAGAIGERPGDAARIGRGPI